MICARPAKLQIGPGSEGRRIKKGIDDEVGLCGMLFNPMAHDGVLDTYVRSNGLSGPSFRIAGEG